MKIAVIGTGYVGLVTGTCFAETGNTVICVDIDSAKVDKLSGGKITIYEPGLEKIFLRNQKENRLHFTTSLAEGIKDAQVIFLALPTPPGEDGRLPPARRPSRPSPLPLAGLGFCADTCKSNDHHHGGEGNPEQHLRVGDV